MANVLKYCVTKSADCKSWTITDKSGIYSATNTGGWGSPNHALSTALTATLNVEKRNSDGTWSTSELSPVSAYDTLPSQTDGTYTLTAEACGYGTGATFADGIYRITYTVTGDDSGAYTLSTVFYYTHTCAIDCCYQEKALAAITCNCVCDDANKELQTIAFYRRLLSSAICCANLSLIQTYIDLLTKLCATCASCSTGCSSC